MPDRCEGCEDCNQGVLFSLDDYRKKYVVIDEDDPPSKEYQDRWWKGTPDDAA